MFPYVCAICLMSQRSNQNILCCKAKLLDQQRSGVVDVFGLMVTNKKQLFLSFSFSFQHYFLIVFGHDGQKPLELRTEEESECDEWVEAIQQARYTHSIAQRVFLYFSLYVMWSRKYDITLHDHSLMWCDRTLGLKSININLKGHIGFFSCCSPLNINHVFFAAKLFVFQRILNFLHLLPSIIH